MKKLKLQKNFLTYQHDYIIYDKRIKTFVDSIDVFEKNEKGGDQRYVFLQKVGIDKTKNTLYVGDIIKISGVPDSLFYFDFLKSKLILRCLNLPHKIFNYYLGIEKLITKIGNIMTISILI